MFFTSYSLFFHSKNTDPKTLRTTLHTFSMFGLPHFRILIPICSWSLNTSENECRGFSSKLNAFFNKKRLYKGVVKKSKQNSTLIKITQNHHPNTKLDMRNLSDKRLKVYKSIFPKISRSLFGLGITYMRVLDFKH